MNFTVTCSSGTLTILCSVLTCSILKTEVSNLMTSIKQKMGFWIPIYIELDSLNKEFFQMDHLGFVRVSHILPTDHPLWLVIQVST